MDGVPTRRASVTAAPPVAKRLTPRLVGDGKIWSVRTMRPPSAKTSTEVALTSTWRRIGPSPGAESSGVAAGEMGAEADVARAGPVNIDRPARQ